MKTDKNLQRLQEIVEPGIGELIMNAIIPDGSGYSAFGCYDIYSQSDRWYVAKTLRDPIEFSSSRTALGWCIADKYNQIQLSSDIARLDREKRMLSSDISVRAKLRDRITNPDLKETIDVKLSTRRHRLEYVESRLNKCVSHAKYLQIRGFNNETSRIRRTTSNR